MASRALQPQGHRPTTARGRLARVSLPVALLFAAFLALGAGAVALAIASRPSLPVGDLGVILLMIPFAVVGLVVANRQPRNTIGWILVALALLTTLGLDASHYALMVYHLHDHGLPLGRLAVALAPAWVPVLVLLPLPIVLFPAGKLPPGRWRWTVWGYLALVVVVFGPLGVTDLGAFIDRRVVVDSTGTLAAVAASPHGAAAILNVLAVAAYAALVVSIAVFQVVHFRRATGDERQQLKWLLAGGTVAVTGLLLAAQWNALGFLFLCVVALPVGIGIGILKYRLYDIDRLISRTISYAIVTGLLVGVFLATVVLATRVLPFSSPVGVAASTLAAAALFNPLRRHVQRLVDRRFNRARYDTEATVAAFTARARDAVDLDTIGAELVRAVDQAIAPAHASVWIRSS